jgi:hypothetical protein
VAPSVPVVASEEIETTTEDVVMTDVKQEGAVADEVIVEVPVVQQVTTDPPMSEEQKLKKLGF